MIRRNISARTVQGYEIVKQESQESLTLIGHSAHLKLDPVV